MSKHAHITDRPFLGLFAQRLEALSWLARGLEPAAAQAVPVEHITIEPPIWCHACGRMLTATGTVAGAQIIAVCGDCVAQADGPDRRQPHRQRLRELVEITRLLAWHVEDGAATCANSGLDESARVMRELAAAADRAIEALRTHPEEG